MVNTKPQTTKSRPPKILLFHATISNNKVIIVGIRWIMKPVTDSQMELFSENASSANTLINKANAITRIRGNQVIKSFMAIMLFYWVLLRVCLEFSAGD